MDRQEHSATDKRRRRGRPRDARLDAAVLAAAARALQERGFAGMSMEAVAGAAGTTAPALYRRYRDKGELAAAVVDTLRVHELPPARPDPRAAALAQLENFRRNLERPRAMAMLGSLLAEEHRHPALVERFRSRFARPRRTALAAALAEGVRRGELAADFDVEAAVNQLIGAFYARLVLGDPIPPDWPERILSTLWPPQR